MKLELFGITWAQVDYFFVFVGLGCAVLLLLLFRLKKIKQSVSRLFSYFLFKDMVQNFSFTRCVIKAFLFFIGFLFLCLALLRPQWNKKDEVVQQEGRDLFVAIDVSRSMLVKDVELNRLELAKKKIKTLVNNLKCDRVGLLIFSGSTSIQCPLTSDYAAFFMFLDQIDVETISSGTTAIDRAIIKTLDTFAQMPTRKNKLLVLFTDGEDFSTSLEGVNERAKKEGMTIFALGVGTQAGGPVPLVDEKNVARGHLKNKDGSIIISRLNKKLLQSLTKKTGGTYLDIAKDDSDIADLISLVEKFEKEAFDDRKIASLQEQYPYFLGVSFVAFALEWLL